MAAIVIFIHLVFFAAPLFLKNDYDISHSQEFELNMKEEFFDLLADFNRHKEWNPWFQDDSTVMFEISTPSRGVGAYYKWSSDTQGSGLQKMTQVQEGEFIQLLFVSEAEGQAHSSYLFETGADKLTITWRIWGHSNDYFGKYISHFMGNMMIPVMKAGFKNLNQAASP